MAYVTVDVDVELDEFSDAELIAEVEARALHAETVSEEAVLKWFRQMRWHDLADELERRVKAPVADHEALKRWLEAVGAA
jgi:hypothetical protein